MLQALIINGSTNADKYSRINYMKILKLFLTFTVLISILALAGYVGITLFDSYSSGPVVDSPRQESTIKGITLDSLNEEGIGGEMRVYLNGTDSSKVVQYKLNSGRVKELVSLEDTIPYYFPGKFAVSGNDFYWIGQEDARYYINHKNLIDNKESQTIYEESKGKVLAGLFTNSSGVFFTSYEQNEDDSFSFEVLNVGGSKKTLVNLSEREILLVPAGEIKGKLILREYNLQTNQITGKCLNAIDLKELTCVGLNESGYWPVTQEPTSLGLEMGKKGYIDLIDKSIKTRRVLEGEVDEYFDEVNVAGQSVFYISGVIEQAYSRSQGEGVSYGSFKPMYLETKDIDGGEREQLAVLPSNNSTKIEYVADSFILLAISESSTNKFEVKPYNLWIYDRKNGDLKKLSDIDCNDNEFCEVSFIQYINN